MYSPENLHARGLLPTRYFNQLNGKSKTENYKTAKNKAKRKNKRKDNFLLSFIEKLLHETLRKSLKDILDTIKLP